MNAPKYHDGKSLKSEEIFRSSNAKPTRELAQQVLECIRDVYNPSHGWIELEAWIEKTPDGFVAVRHHAQYK